MEGLHTANADGSGVAKLADSGRRPYVWSPGSTRLAYITTEPGKRSDDYDEDDPGTWPDSTILVGVAGFSGASPVILRTPHSYHPMWLGCVAITLIWRQAGIEIVVEEPSAC